MSRYRRDIDGLRALAVSGVVVFHAWPSLLPAGFIGVDVFFVISGFLISTIILEDIEQGTFRFAAFYARRVRRIFPALLLVLLACLVFGWFVLLTDEYTRLGEHTAASAAFLSNFMFWSESGYFDVASETKPLLHLWSLGIEEQFYIVWPLLLVAAWKIRFKLLLIAILAAASFGLNVIAVGHDGVADFYSPLTRFWELLSGGLLAGHALHHPNTQDDADKVGLSIANGASLLGAALLACGFLCIGRDTAFPGFWALLPVAGTALLIFAGPQAWFNRAVLSRPALVWLGLISYPLYLWHWPLLSYERILDGSNHERSAKVIVILVALAVLLAWLTYRLIERPVRHGKYGKGTAGVLALLMACMGALGFGVYHFDGIGARTVNALNQVIGSSGDDGGYLTGDCGLAPSERRQFVVCAGDSRGGIKYLLLGDSKAKALYPGLVQTSVEKSRWKVIVGASANGPLVPIMSDEPEYAESQQRVRIAIDAASKDAAIREVVIVVAMRTIFHVDDMVKEGNLRNYDHRYLLRVAKSNTFDKAHAGMKRAISQLIAAGKKVTIVVDNPPLPAPRDCINRKTSNELLDSVLMLKNRELNQACYLPLAQFEAEAALYRKLLSALQHDFPDSFEVFDATDIYCDTGLGVCGPMRNGRLLYAYTDHITDYAADLVGARLNAHLNQNAREAP